MIIKQLSVFLQNKTGRLTELTRTLSESGINMTAFSIADTADYGIVRFIVPQPEEALRILKEKGFSVNTTDVVCLIVPNEPGGLYRALQVLSDNEVPIEYMYAFASENGASVVIRSESNTQVIDVLQANKIQLMRASEIYNL
ncbi:MAG: amino acid-binding protein [Paludibacter sp.]|jgi:hypothetical protein|nr:amino acid-binding protein [Paludibacter sp.]